MRRSLKDSTMFSISLRRVLFTVIGLVAAGTASAGTITTWSGTGATNNWSANGNWAGNLKPTVSGTTFSLVYGGNPTRTTSTNDLGGQVKVDSILFANTGVTGSTSAFILSRTGTASLSLAAGGSVTSAAASSALTDTISSPIALLGSGTFNMGTNHNLTLSGTLSGAGSIVKTGAGLLTLSGANDLSGLKIDEGVVAVNQTAFNGISGLTVELGSAGNAGTLRTTAVGTPLARSITTMQVNLKGDANIVANSNSNLTFSAAQFNVANAGITAPVVLGLGGAGAGFYGEQTISGVIQDNSGSGTVGVSVVGGNIWTLAGNNTYTGATTVSGKLLLTGNINSASAVTSTGYIGGTGTFGGAVTITSGTLAPGGLSGTGGIITDSIGALTVQSLSLGSAATTELTVTGSTSGLYDQLIGSSTLNYGGTLALTMNTQASYDDFTTFNLFSGFTSTSGTLGGITLNAVGTDFAGLTFTQDGSTGDWYTGWIATGGDGQQLKFSQSTGTLTVVPEPSTIVFAGIGMVMFGWSTWTRRRAKSRRQAIEAAIA
jgi:autotransporter-associated beta strand protein